MTIITNTASNPVSMSNARRCYLASVMTRAHKAARRMRPHFATYRAALSAAMKRVWAARHAAAYLAANVGRTLVARFVKADSTVRNMTFTYDGKPAISGSVLVTDTARRARRRVNLDTLGFIRPADRPAVAPAPRPKVGDWNADVSKMSADELDAHSLALFG